MKKLIGLLLLSSAAFAERPYPLLSDTPPYVCERLIYGDKYGSRYVGPTFDRIKALLEWRYDVELIGLDEILTKNAGGAFFIPNHSTPTDPAIVLIAIGGRTAIRPLVTGNLKAAPLLDRVFDGTNAFLQPEPLSGGRTAITLLEGLIREMANAVRHGDNVLFYPSGYAQTQIYDHLAAQTMVHRLLAIDPEARFVLVRQRGLWGSSFGHGTMSSSPHYKFSTNAAIVRGLLNGARIAATNGPLTPKRKVTFEFVEPTDFPRRGSVAEINAYLTNFYRDGAPERRTFVKGHFLLPWPTARVSDEVIDYGAAPQRWARPAGDPGVAVDPLVRTELGRIVKAEFGIDDARPLAGELDSIARVQLFLAIEENLGVRLADDAGFSDLDDLARQITRLRGESSILERSLNASRSWFRDEATLRARPWRHFLKLRRVDTLAQQIEKWPETTIGVLQPPEARGSVLEAVARRAGKAVVTIDPTDRGTLARLNAAGVSRILTTPEYLHAVSISHDVAAYYERFVMIETLRPVD